MEDLDGNLSDDPSIADEIHDIKQAIATVARRSDSLMSFVTSYRKLTRLPATDISRISIQPLIEDVNRVVSAAAITMARCLPWCCKHLRQRV